MNFSHYSEQPAELAVDLVNSGPEDNDEMGDLTDLETFLERHRELLPSELRPPTPSDLAKLRRLRGRLRQVFEAEDTQHAVERLNDILDETGATPRLTVHDGAPHLHFEPVGATVSAWVGAITAMGLAGIVVEHGVSRFGTCQASTCNDVFVDTSRNRSRIHCCGTCSTREAVAAYRRRQAT